MADKALLRLRRVTDLFSNGRELVLAADADDGPVLIWLEKLNTFQRGECHRDAEAAQARRIAGLSDDSDEMRAAAAQLAHATPSEMVEFILAPQAGTFYLRAQDDVRAEEGWKEKLTLLERDAALETGGSPATKEEREAITGIQLDYIAAIEAAQKVRYDDAAKDLEQVPEEELRAKYYEVARNNMAEHAYWNEFRRTELYLSVRDCTATRLTQDGYDHAACTHLRLLPTKAAVNDIPQELLDRIRNGLSEVNMTPAEAGNSAAPQTSSESAEPQSNAEDSTPSTPTET